MLWQKTPLRSRKKSWWHLAFSPELEAWQADVISDLNQTQP